ncbi:MAG TPA: sugar porter family MFS transporter [Rhodanobacteraceae bacterium]
MAIAAGKSSENTGFIIVISLVAAIGGFLFGFDSGVINGTVDGLEQAFHSNSVGTGFDVASMLLGCAAGAFSAGRLADLYGRRSVLIVAAVFFIVSGWGSGISASSVEFVIYRLIGGAAVGAASVMAPAYISEVSLARYRGRLASMQQIAIIFGLFAAFLSNYLLARTAGASTNVLWLGFEAWRWMFWIELVPAVVFLASLLFIPESPRYLVVKGRNEQSLAVLTKLYGAITARGKQAEIETSLSGDHRPRLADLIDKAGPRKRVRPIVWAGLGLAVLQQLVGINVVFYYGAVLWQAVGFSENDALLINILSGALSVAACLVALALIDRIGRKPLLWVGSVGMTVTLTLVACAFATAHMDAAGHLALSGAMGVLALVAANAYVVFFNASWGPVMWVMLGEMFPNRIRGSALAVAGAAQWLANFLVTMTFPILLAGIGLAVTYGIYAFAALLSVVFVLKCINETSNKELEQMQG